MNGDVTAWSRRKAQVGGPFTTLARISVSDVWHEFPTGVYSSLANKSTQNNK